MLGHRHSPYFTIKETERKEIYLKCEPYLTFLNYGALENVGKNIEAKLEEKDREIAYLHEAGAENKDLMTSMSDRLIKLTQQVEELQRKSNAQSKV